MTDQHQNDNLACKGCELYRALDLIFEYIAKSVEFRALIHRQGSEEAKCDSGFTVESMKESWKRLFGSKTDR